MVRTWLNSHFNRKTTFLILLHAIFVPQAFRSGSKFNFSVFWEGKLLNFENTLTRLPAVSILLTSLCDQDIICSTRVSYQVNPNKLCRFFLVNCELNSRTHCYFIALFT